MATYYKVTSVRSQIVEDSFVEGEYGTLRNYDRFDEIAERTFNSIPDIIYAVNDDFNMNFSIKNAVYKKSTLMLHTYLNASEDIPTDDEQYDYANDVIYFLGCYLDLTIEKVTTDLGAEFEELGIEKLD